MNALSEKAAAWIVRLSGDDAGDRERAHVEFERWKQADPRHAVAAARMEGLIGQVQGLRECGRPARTAIDAVCMRRRRVRRRGAAMAICFALALPALTLLNRAQPLGYWLADLRSGTGEWPTHTLADGSTLTLGSGSTVNLHFDQRNRVVELLRGSVRIEVAHDAARPLRVDTEHGTVRALGTRFAVTRRHDATQLDMLESRVAVRSAHGDEAIEVGAGKRLFIHADHITAPEPIDARSVDDAWQHRQLVVHGEPLADVLKRLAQHRRGLILFDADDLAAIRVSAVLPLDDTDRALQLLAKNFPTLRFASVTDWLVTVEIVEPD